MTARFTLGHLGKLEETGRSRVGRHLPDPQASRDARRQRNRFDWPEAFFQPITVALPEFFVCLSLLSAWCSTPFLFSCQKIGEPIKLSEINSFFVLFCREGFGRILLKFIEP